MAAEQSAAELEHTSTRDSEDEGSDAGVEGTWLCSTILHAPNVIDPAFIDVLERYFRKKGDTIWQRSVSADTSDVDEDDECEAEDDTRLRKCHVARGTSTLQRMYAMLDAAVEDLVEQFMERYPFFSLVSTKDDYTVLRFEKGDFYAEHVECTGLDDDNDGASRRLCIIVFLSEPPAEGGSLRFTYQDVTVKANKGGVLVFPSCPLHPNSTTPIESNDELLYAVNYIM